METFKHELKQIFAGLRDFGFKTLITPTVVGAIFVLVAISEALGYLYNSIDLLSDNTTVGVLYVFIFGPLLALIALLWYRVFLELAVVFFRILEIRRERSALLDRVGSRAD
ncbi:MAG: DUF4282 domain-containing protein [Solirubrobacterales bacterium]